MFKSHSTEKVHAILIPMGATAISLTPRNVPHPGSASADPAGGKGTADGIAFAFIRTLSVGCSRTRGGHQTTNALSQDKRRVSRHGRKGFDDGAPDGKLCRKGSGGIDAVEALAG